MDVSTFTRVIAPAYPRVPSYAGIAALAFAIGVLATSDVESLRSWMLFALAGCVPPVLMAARGAATMLRTQHLEVLR
jgi:hypothetical protein